MVKTSTSILFYIVEFLGWSIAHGNKTKPCRFHVVASPASLPSIQVTPLHMAADNGHVEVVTYLV